MGVERYNLGSSDWRQGEGVPSPRTRVSVTVVTRSMAEMRCEMAVNGKTVVITGASRGIGAAAGKAFAAAGANVVLAARSAQAIENLAAEIGEKAIAVVCDVSDFESVSKLMQAAEAAFGSVDVLVNNAGMIEPVAHLSAIDPSDWDRVIDVNVKGLIRAWLLPVTRFDNWKEVLIPAKDHHKNDPHPVEPEKHIRRRFESFKQTE